MSESERLIDQFQRAHDGDPWHGPSVREVLRQVRDLTRSMKALRPIVRALLGIGAGGERNARAE
jgi:hypothetical protein